MFLYIGGIIGHKYRDFHVKWFVAHLTFQLCGVILVLTGFFIILYDHNFQFHISMHSMFGLIAIIGLFLQMILGLISNRISAVREIMHTLHCWTGRVTLINGYITMILAFYYYSVGYVSYIFCAIWLIGYLIVYFLPIKSYAQLQKEKETPEYSDESELEMEAEDHENDNSNENNNSNEDINSNENQKSKNRKNKKKYNGGVNLDNSVNLEQNDDEEVDNNLNLVVPKIMTRPAIIILVKTILSGIGMTVTLSVIIYLTLT